MAMAAREGYFTYDDMLRGPFGAIQAVALGGYRLMDRLAIFALGERAEQRAYVLDPEDSARIPRLRERMEGQLTSHELVPGVRGPWLVDVPLDGGTWDGGPFENKPILHAARNEQELHRRFAGLKTRTAILRFANRYGFLGAGYTCQARLSDEPLPRVLLGTTGWVGAEHLGHWWLEISRMACLLQLWDWVAQEREDQLRKLVWWRRSPLGVGIKVLFMASGHPLPWVDQLEHEDQPGEPLRRTLAGASDGWDAFPPDPDVPPPWQYGDVLRPAYTFVAQEVNRSLARHVDLRVRGDREGLYFAPDSLLASLYTLFALELSGRDRQRTLCARDGCGRYFIVRHKRQRYCNDNCRKRASDERKLHRIKETGL
jgi:hypothetical protein